MEKIAIFTDSASDISGDKYKDRIGILPLYYYFHNEETEYGDKIKLSMDDYFKKMVNGGIPRTAAVNTEKAIELFSIELEKGNDIICINMSSGLSSSFNNVALAGTILSEKYPDRKITVIDSLTVSLAEGLIALKALKLKEEGTSYEDIVKYLETYKKYYNIEFFIDDLSYLVRGGRISKASAMAGHLLQVKPLLYVDEFGKANVAEKVRGTKKLDSTLIDRMVSRIDENVDSIGIIHSNNIDDALRLREKIEALKLTRDYVTAEIGPIIASHAGPKAFGLTYKMKNPVK